MALELYLECLSAENEESNISAKNVDPLQRKAVDVRQSPKYIKIFMMEMDGCLFIQGN